MVNKVKKVFQSFQNSRNRLRIIVGIIVLFIFLLFLYYHFKRQSDVAPSNVQVSNVPARINTVPGQQQVSPEYLQILLQANEQQAAKALKTGQSSLPTVVGNVQTVSQGNVFTPQQPTTASQQISADASVELQQLQNSNASVSDYAAALNQLVAEGKLTPAQAQALLADYVRTHGGTTSELEQLLASGAITPDVANDLQKLQDSNVTPDAYAAELNKLVAEGKLTPEQAQALLADYKQKYNAGATNGVGSSDDDSMASLSPDVAADLKQLQDSGATPDQYAAELNKLVAEGKLTPAQAQALLADYKKKHAPATANDLVGQLQADGALDSASAQSLKAMSDQNAPASDYANQLSQLVTANKLTPDEALKLLSAYRQQHGDTSIDPNQVADKNLALLQQQQQEQALQQQLAQLQQQQQAQQQAAQQQQAQAQQQAQTAMQSAVSSQAQQLLAAWQPPVQQLLGGGESSSTTQAQTQAAAAAAAKAAAPTLIKAGDIMFAVLVTGVNSDRPGPVLATIVEGPFKGAKLIGGLQLTPDKQRVVLQFTQMTMPNWPDVTTINAYAINPDTAHTAIASSVNNHYLLRYGSLFAASFLQGLGQAAQTSGSSISTNTTTGSNTSQYSDFNTRDQILIGLGQVGANASSAVNQLYNTPPTVKVDAGVGLGILFTQTVTEPSFLMTSNNP